jgi:hypothetical protein
MLTKKKLGSETHFVCADIVVKAKVRVKKIFWDDLIPLHILATILPETPLERASR